MATGGVEQVAETGGNDILLSELAASSSIGNVVVGSATFNRNTQMQTFNSITMTPSNRYLSTISMIAPSPDWFSGFYDFDAINDDTQTWYREFSVVTYPFDAGTEEGDTYGVNNVATNPLEPILRFGVNTVPTTGVFLNDSEDDVLPVATWTCTLEQPDPAPAVIGLCFPGHSLVEVKNRGLVSLDQINVGDEVKVGLDVFDRVYSFGHKTSSREFAYLQIQTTGKSNPLEISTDHMVFVVDAKTAEKRAVPASHVKVGDWLAADSTAPTQVASVTNVFRRGAYAPFTMAGTIVVNGVVSSSYVSLQGTDTLMIGRMKMPLNMHFVAHFFTSPFRLLTVLGVRITESYNDDGISIWIALPHRITKELLTENAFVFGAVVILAAVVILPFYVLELVLSSHLLLAYLVFAATIIYFRGRGRAYQTKNKSI